MTTPAVKRIVCLANSRMFGGRCIAGKEWRTNGRPGGWVRPVSGREGEGVDPSESRYASGGEPRLLDVMDVPVLAARPEGHQRENWQLDLTRRWVKVGQVERSELPKLSDTPDTLWVNGSSASSGLNDRVRTSDANSLNSSLYLIEASLELCVFSPGANFGDFRRRVQGRFRHNDEDYRMWVTDPDYEDDYLGRPNGSYQLGQCLLTVSLGGAHVSGYCYKLIAAIIEP